MAGAPNPKGAVAVFDGQNPEIISVVAGVGVTGGQLVFFSGANNLVSSGVDSYNTNEVRIAGLASGGLYNGIVITPGNTASGTNNLVSVGQHGTYILNAAGTIIAGNAIFPNGGDAVIGGNDTITGSYSHIGRAISPAGSEGYSIVRLF